MIPQLQFLNEVIDVPVVQVVQLPRWWSQLQFSDKVYMPVVAGLVQVARQCRKLWFCRSCSSSQFVDLPVVVQRTIPMVFLLGRPWRLRSCSFFSGGRCPCCAGRVPCPCWAFSTTGYSMCLQPAYCLTTPHFPT